MKKITSVVATIISLILIIAGTVGLILLQKPLREESQDIRRDASVDSGQVAISSTPNSGTTIKVGERTISFLANTQGVQTDGIQLVFNLITDTLGSTPVISVPTASGMQAAYQQIEQTSDGYLVSVIAVPQQIGQAFSSTSPVAIAQLKINPDMAGSIEINFDREKSKSIVQGTNPPQDALNHVIALNYTISDDSGGSPSPSLSPSPSPATGGITVKGCNLSCNSNAECETNNRCYNGQCRLVTNVSSTTCQPETDQGLSFGCNSYCADSRECDSQYACLENKCRRADNPDDAACKIPSSTIQDNVAASCSTGCSDNADCAANLRCYYGSCRLATNVSSSTCVAATKKTVSVLYTKPAAPKGGDLEDQPDATDSTMPAAIISQPSPSPSASTKPKVKEETALDAVVESARKAGLPINLLPIIALGAGGLILLLIIIPKLFGDKTKRGPIANPQQKINQESGKYEQELQAKLDQLKQQPAPPTTMAKPQAPTSVSRPTPPVSGHQPSATPPQSTMMERVKEKGVTPPKS